ncbi:bifunctional 5,10-methylenetetrahydrofolate dehydrogenase/5,10-methenyltetrahydrofolate cyclohydrolase [Facklamia sp. DSM 111018]|uniref:Bifunctional protein FolD n=1 Tax=Facklamia lactis TaxID=2749967 RepID=A0ABS0LTZ8_9LACT|nr:tetrahydrofolate dehydrogenase/cyclohydrolase catalytic domain-containing protein [Facklamia lactis]MBG9980858.1 bifunctional 5,10-methylenetetrahydrofolate dehydrogenase/5,10-methenyltetrahydrofolate cyclohydrolase [Facklamia lactis]MBG9986779.1 bifunctional 5,10-methylenetetrahydrofolate dehydrogenase/5,10-methenyltetrahydrofolate cyclohydrolase [Facklamia lactis]
MAKILDGKEVGKAIRERTKQEADALREQGIVPKLVVLRVDENPSSMAYEKNAIKVMEKCGIDAEARTELEAKTTEDVLKIIDELNADESVSGVIIMQPFPEGIERAEIAERLNPFKDVDALNPVNLGKLINNDPTAMAPSTAQACIEILDYYDYELEGAEVCVVGSSPVVGKPLAVMLSNRNATVSNTHVYTKDNTLHTTLADILVSATGALGLVGPDYIKEGATVIDVGFGYKDGKATGDVRFEEVEPKASAITPVPGGVGSVTTGVLASQVVKGAKLLNNVE